MRKYWFVSAVILTWIALVVAARCQEQPFMTKPFLTKTTSALILADAGAKLADFHYSMRASRITYTTACGDIPAKGYTCWTTSVYTPHEEDPIARPFINHGPVRAGVYFAGIFALDTFGAYELHRHGHNRMAQGVLLIGIGENTEGAAFSSRH
jgi:hypothetical protein